MNGHVVMVTYQGPYKHSANKQTNYFLATSLTPYQNDTINSQIVYFLFQYFKNFRNSEIYILKQVLLSRIGPMEVHITGERHTKTDFQDLAIRLIRVSAARHLVLTLSHLRTHFSASVADEF